MTVAEDNYESSRSLPNLGLSEGSWTISKSATAATEPCPNHGLRLESRPERVITPLDSTHRTVVMAIERGMLQDLIFDNHALASHRAMAAILGTILKLPLIRQSLASQQMRSRYLESLLAWCRERYSPVGFSMMGKART